MKNELARKILDETPPEVKERVRKYADDLESIETIIDDAYKLYMPQVRGEITDLTRFLLSHWEGNKITSPNILEIGTKFGGTFYIWNKLIEMIGSGQSISIDLDDKGLHGGIGDERMDKRDLWFLERFKNCHFIRGDSHSAAVWNQVSSFAQMNPPGGTLGSPVQLYEPFLDFLFIDGDHSYSGVKKDWEDYSPFVKKGGIVVLHDINDSERHRERNVFVSKFWQEIKDDPRFDSFEINANEDWAGISVSIKL